MRSLLLLALAVLPITAQTLPFQPSYLVGSGVSYDYYGKTGFAVQSAFAARIGTTKLYSYSDLANTSTTASINTGAAYCFAGTANISLWALGTAGLISGSGSPILGQFQGGGMMMYDVGNRLKPGNHYYVVGGVSVQNIASVTVRPIYFVGFAAGF